MLTGRVSAGSGAGVPSRTNGSVKLLKCARVDSSSPSSSWLRICGRTTYRIFFAPGDPVDVGCLVQLGGDALQAGDGHHVDERPGSPDVDDHQCPERLVADQPLAAVDAEHGQQLVEDPVRAGG